MYGVEIARPRVGSVGRKADRVGVITRVACGIVARHRLNEGEDTAVLPAVGDGGEPPQWRDGEADPRQTREIWIHRLPFLAAVGGVCVLLIASVVWSLSPPAPSLSWSGSVAPRTHDGNVTSADPTGTPSVVPSVTASASASASPQPTGSSSPAPTPTSTPTPAPTPTQVGLVIDSPRSLESVGLPGDFVVANGTYGELAQVTAGSAAATKQAATLTVVAGLADASCYTFRTESGSYLRHRNFQLRVDPYSDTALFRNDATFCARGGSVSGSVSFESVNYPGQYLHRSGTALQLDTLVDTDAFRADCSFRVTLPWT